MTTAIAYDATHLNVSFIPADAEVVLGYDTGTSDIRWSQADWDRFTTSRKVHIDQGGLGSPVPTATVRDVETGAWSPEAAVTQTRNWNAGRRTIYCNLDTLPRVLAAGWQGDLWLAIPANQQPSTPPAVHGCTVVAVQFKFAGEYDMSVVFDPYWPARAPSLPGVTFAAPSGLRQTATVEMAWNVVPDANGEAPASYQVEFLGLDGRVYASQMTPVPYIAVHGLTPGWTYNVHVWANGGDNAPPHAEIIVHT